MESFIEALRAEYIESRGNAVGKYLDKHTFSSKQEALFDQLEDRVRQAGPEAAAVIAQIATQYGKEPIALGGDGSNSTANTPKPRRPRKCRFFAKGECKNGEECKFLHEPPAAAEDCSSGSSSSSGSSASESSSSDSDDADDEEEISKRPWINIERYFEQIGDTGLPEEVTAMFDGKSLPGISECRRLKCSFNETWLLELDADLPLCANSTARSRHPTPNLIWRRHSTEDKFREYQCHWSAPTD